MRLAAYLRREKIRPATFARLIGCSKPYLSRLLSGERAPSGRLLARIERLTEGAVTLGDFYTATGKVREAR